MTSLTAFAAVDELGYVPKHWYRFIGDLKRSWGETDLTWSANPSVYVDSDIEGSRCAIGPNTGNGGSGSGIVFGSGDWTVVVKGRMDSTVGSILLSLGDAMGTGETDSSVSLTYEGDGKVGVSPCTDGSKGARNAVNKYDVPDATAVFHTYALQFTYNSDPEKRILALWVDGEKMGEFNRDMLAKDYAKFTFFGTPTKTKGISTFALGDPAMTSAVSDFRVYQRLLTPAELRALANPPLDEIGSRPLVWYPFNGSVAAEAAGFAPIVTLIDYLAAYTTGRDGIANSAVSAAGSRLAGINMPWGAGSGTKGGDWTVVLDMKGEDNANAVYFATGNGSADTCFALASAGAGKVRLVKYSGTADYAAAFSVDVPDASTAFHQYAIVRSGTKIQLYVDGVFKGEETRDNPGDNGFTLFRSPGGNGANGLYDAAASVLDDFRVYKRALTVEQLSAIRAGARDEFGGTPTHWYKFDGSLASSGRRELGFESEFSGAAFDTSDGALLATGDNPYGTNIALGGNSWTMIVKAKSADADNAVLVALGSSLKAASASVALTSAGAGRVALSGFGDGAEHADLITAEVADASSAFHTYAIVRDGGIDSLWVDAVRVGTVARPDPTCNGFAFFGVHDGLGKTKLVAPSSGAAIADFRVYDRALTQLELAAISGSSDFVSEATWTGAAGDGLVTTPGNWTCKDATGKLISDAVPGSAATVRFVGSLAVQLPAGTALEYNSLYFDCTLTGDCDWSGLAAADVSGTVDIAGKELTLAGLFGYGTVTDTVGNGVLRLVVGSGATVNGNTLSLAGGLKFVKEGAGTYVAIKPQTYSGGTDIAAGYAKFGANGDALPFGASGSTIAVSSGAELDANGMVNQYPYSVRLDGGTLANRGAQQPMDGAGFANIQLTADSGIYLGGDLNIANPNNAATSLNLGGRTLTVNAASNSRLFRLHNCAMVNGMVKTVHAISILVIRYGATASDVDFDIGSKIHPYSDISVRDFTLRADADYHADATSTISVAGVFKPLVAGVPGTCLLNGSVIDLAGYSGTFSLVNPAYSDRAVTFAPEANVTVNLAGRTDLESIAASASPYIATWASMPDANFVVDAETSAAKFSVRKNATGLRLVKVRGLVVSVR